MSSNHKPTARLRIAMPTIMRNAYISMFSALLVSLCGTSLIMADAADGEFMGYKLGSNYQGAAEHVKATRTNGTLIVQAANPVKPDDITDVFLIVTEATKTIGQISGSTWFDSEAKARSFAIRYVNLLHTKYADWQFGREQMGSDLRIVEVNLDKRPYNIRFYLDEEEHDDKMMWRFSMTLSWLPKSKEALAWNNMVNTQHIAIADAERKQMLKDADVRGL